MTDALGRTNAGPRDPSQDRRGRAIDDFMFLMQYRRDLVEAKRNVLAPLYPDDARAVDVDLQQVDCAIHDAALELAASRPEVPAEQLAPTGPNVEGFYRAVAGILGADGAGAKRLFRIDRDYPGIDRHLRAGVWDMALAGIGALLTDGVVTQAEYDAIQLAWDEASLGRPAAA